MLVSVRLLGTIHAAKVERLWVKFIRVAISDVSKMLTRGRTDLKTGGHDGDFWKIAGLEWW